MCLIKDMQTFSNSLSMDESPACCDVAKDSGRTKMAKKTIWKMQCIIIINDTTCQTSRDRDAIWVGLSWWLNATEVTRLHLRLWQKNVRRSLDVNSTSRLI